MPPSDVEPDIVCAEIDSMPESNTCEVAIRIVACMTFAGSAETNVPASCAYVSGDASVTVPGPVCAVPTPFGNGSGVVALTAVAAICSVEAPS